MLNSHLTALLLSVKNKWQFSLVLVLINYKISIKLFTYALSNGTRKKWTSGAEFRDYAASVMMFLH